jgi:hypothetical protein
MWTPFGLGPSPSRNTSTATGTFDRPNLDQEFLGLYSVYKGAENQTWDLYFPAARGLFRRRTSTRTLFGGRWRASREAWQLEVEGGSSVRASG